MAAWSLPEPTVFPPRSLDGDEPTAAPKGKELFKGYIRVNERRTQLEGRDVVDWHVAGHVFAFDSAKCTTTLVYEYAQGPHRMLLGLPAGRVGKKTAIEAGMAELSEEVQLRAPADRWVELGDGTGFAEGKWITSIAQPLLVIDPEPDETPGKQDAEEDIQVVRDVPLAELRKLIAAGKILVASAQTAFMAIDHLKRHGHAEALARAGW